MGLHLYLKGFTYLTLASLALAYNCPTGTYCPGKSCVGSGFPLTSDSSSSDWSLTPGQVIERTCPSCASTHQTIIYKRLTDPGSIDFKDLFLMNWFSSPSGGSNILNQDFELFSSYEDAVAGQGRWTYCNYDDAGVGFPRDCGPTGAVGSQWNKASNFQVLNDCVR